MKAFTVTFYPEKFTSLTLSFGAGCAPIYSVPNDTGGILERIAEFEKITNCKGGFNQRYPTLENYALCLLQEKKRAAAYELFTIITRGVQNIVLVKKAMIANKRGKLGIEGAFQFAQLCLEYGNEMMAKVLFRELAENGPFRMGIRGGDIWVKSASQVLQLNAYHGSGEEERYNAIYKQAKSEQY